MNLFLQNTSLFIPKMKNQSGLSLIATILTLLMFSLFIAVAVSLVTTGAHIGVQETQGQQAFYIAEGGSEFESRNLATNLDWYRSATDPMTATTQNLGAGSFTVSSNLPATKLTAQVTAASTNPIRVYTVERYPSPSGCIRIDNEYISYANVGTTQAACSGNPPCFTSITRGVGACFGGGANASHSRGAAVYPATTLSAAIPDATSTAITIVWHQKFLSAGTIDIEGEEIAYAGSTITGGNMTLQGVLRGQNGTPAAAHAANLPVTPILWNGASPDYEAESVSTGTVSSSVRVVKKTVQR